MAISAVHYRFMLAIAEHLPRGGDVLQVGDANLYHDVNPQWIHDLCANDSERDVVRSAVASGNLFRQAKAFYTALFRPNSVTSVDINGSDGSLRLDLNAPLRLERQYDVSVNHGTAEHVFHVAQVFGTMHAWTKPGGLMVHESPWQGWPDHGFYSIHPTLYYDVAAANGYEMVNVCVASITQNKLIHIESRRNMHALIRDVKVPENAVLFVAMRHRGGDFRIPMQGIYDGTLDADGKQLWKDAR